MSRTVYIVVKDGMIVDAYADHLTDLVILDLDTNSEEEEKIVQAELKKIQESNDCIEIY